MHPNSRQNDPPNDPKGVSRFGDAMKQMRVRLHLSLAELAERVGCAKSYLSGIENGHKGPPSDELIERLEEALSFPSGKLFECAHWDRTPAQVRTDLDSLKSRERSALELVRLLSSSASTGVSLDELYKSGKLNTLIETLEGQAAPEPSPAMPVSPSGLPMEIPLINKVAAGYPAEFTDLGYPTGIADEYVRSPDVDDPDAFAARVVGDSMEPNYRQGDIVVFSPAKDVRDGMDCFVRLEPDHESTFKRIYFEMDDAGAEFIRIQPINSAYPPRTVPREQVAGLYAGVSVIRPI
ncbi:MAG: LexA family transcriptional regulator [Phycisphaerales bacterium]|nr:LexA family transcriptional regulator [Phycisphaerales bacterium]